MGIEHFFNSIKKKYQGSKNIIKQLDIPPNNNKINSQNIYNVIKSPAKITEMALPIYKQALAYSVCFTMVTPYINAANELKIITKVNE